MVREKRWACHAYCLMGNHYHLLIETPEANLSVGMKKLNGVYAQMFNWKHDRSGHLFEGRFKAVLVERDSYLLEVSRYIVLNPVRAGLVKDPSMWRWSSYRATAGEEDAPDLLTVRFILSMFPGGTENYVARYKEFVLEGVGRTLWEDLRGGILLGGNDFAAKLNEHFSCRSGVKGVPKRQKHASRFPIEQALAEIQGGFDRDTRIYLAFVQFGYSLKEIGEYFGLHVSTVSKIAGAKRAEFQKMGSDPGV